MSCQVLVSGGAYFKGKAPYGVGAVMHPAAKGSFPFLFHYFTGAEECTALPDQDMSSLCMGSQQQPRVHIASASVSDPGMAIRNQNPSPKYAQLFLFTF